MYNTPTNHDLAQVQILLDNNVKWSSHFPYLIINWLKIAWPDELICGVIWICGLSHFINQITSLRKWMLNDCKSMPQNHAAPKVAIMVVNSLFNSLTFMFDAPFRLLFHETIIVYSILSYTVYTLLFVFFSYLYLCILSCVCVTYNCISCIIVL